jgi:hypothetical protein
LARLRAREAAPARSGDGRRVAIYAYSIGADRLCEALRDAPGVDAYLIHGLSPGHLRDARVLVLPQMEDVLDLSPEIIVSLRQWVKAGGTIVLTHDAVGARWHPRLFPEIGEGLDPRQARQVELAVPLAGLPQGHRFEHAYSGHIPLQLAPATEVLIREPAPSGAPVVARGIFGRGRVVLMGLLPGGGGSEMNTEEREILSALVAP